ncbi:cytochrome c oxidase biogenesis protein Cmc1 like-domain-containing protein [Scheffersomyces coipomensis]|uniref:cytochrome c oxidase biogenesis protein Cmc1 like-domain-containing protein n=1 Tax=Scheffersomyces coipomensis TaxID=1788519 RepID=UPI00315DE678
MSEYEKYGIKKKTYSEVELPTNPNLPPWVITPKEEKVIFERWRKKTFAKCDDFIKAYVDCSNSYRNPIEGMKKCAEVNKASKDCVAQYQKQKYLDIERDILIEERIEKKKLYEQSLKEKAQQK